MTRYDYLRRATLLALSVCLLAPLAGLAQETEEEGELGWSNVTDLSLVITDGNSSTETFGLKNRLRRDWERAQYTFRIDAVRSNTADDPIALLRDPDLPEYDVITFDKSLDVENYFVENRYDRSITERFFWNAGLTWDRNKDAGIESRWIGYAGVGHIWWDREDLKFNTSYGLSYTSRQEEDETPDKDDTFAGFRFNWQYENQWGKVTTFENDWTTNYSFSNSTDWSSDMTSSIVVAMNSRLALRVSLQWLYNNLPANQDLDVFAVDNEGNLQLKPFKVQEPKDKLDTIFRTSLVIRF